MSAVQHLGCFRLFQTVLVDKTSVAVKQPFAHNHFTCHVLLFYICTILCVMSYFLQVSIAPIVPLQEVVVSQRRAAHCSHVECSHTHARTHARTHVRKAVSKLPELVWLQAW